MTHVPILDTSKSYYYVHYPYHKDNSVEAYCWLEDTAGAGFTFGGNGIYFYSDQDATLFSLKWL